jgi:two-component system cell cycle response regulator
VSSFPVRTRPLLSRLAGWSFAAVALAAVAYCAHIYFGLGGHASEWAFGDVVYNAVMLGAAIALLLRAITRSRDRAALLLIAAGMASWALGDLYYTIYYSGLPNPPVPSIADALYLAYYPLLYIGVGLLVRERCRGLGVGAWLDGLIAALGLGALAAGLVLDPILSATGGSFGVVATNLAYPVGDLLLFLVVVTAVGLTGWRPGRMWGLMAAALLVQVSADTVYLFQVARGTYVENGWLETLWPLASVLLLAAMWVPSERAGHARTEGWRALVMPCIGALSAVGLLFADHGSIRVNSPARYLALATLVAAAARVGLAFRESRHHQRESHAQAVTDELTGLWNRRLLVEDLDLAVERASPTAPWLLLMFDLNGFKLYNDTFGHPAGDQLLARVGGNLAATVAPYGKAYRMGGDEFCALVRPGSTPIEALAAATSGALCETGDGFEITAAHGHALLPFDAADASAALQLADRRLYAKKESRPVGVKHQLRGVLLEIVGARVPWLSEHLDGVAALALAVGRRMKLEPEAIDELVRAAEMHDVGKTAIPETIINKPGPLDEREWAFMRRHTILGERILSAAPALIPVARLVRSSHERWDGNGYPDGLAGEEIPLGSRIICACDAYDAIISTRPYRAARTVPEALAELARCAGSHFDSAVVEALIAVVSEAGQTAARRPGADDLALVEATLGPPARGASPEPARVAAATAATAARGLSHDRLGA